MMKNRAGFTLIELLIAISILATMTMMIYISFASVVNTMDIARVNAQDLEARRYLQQSIGHNLRGIYYDSACTDPSFQLLSEDESGAYGDADTLRFVASLPVPGAKSMPGQYMEVSYELVDSADDADGQAVAAASGTQTGVVLRITEKPLALAPVGTNFETDKFEYTPRVRDVPINSIKFRFYDGTAEEWVDTWDSIAEQRLPWSVEVSVNFAKGRDAAAADYQAGIDAANNADMTMLITLPTGAGTQTPFIDWNHVRGVDQVDNAGGVGGVPGGAGIPGAPGVPGGGEGKR